MTKNTPGGESMVTKQHLIFASRGDLFTKNTPGGESLATKQHLLFASQGDLLTKNAPGGESMVFVHMIHSYERAVYDCIMHVRLS